MTQDMYMYSVLHELLKDFESEEFNEVGLENNVEKFGINDYDSDDSENE